jgi:hypothetical protein
MNEKLRGFEQSNLLTPQQKKETADTFNRGLHILFHGSTLDFALFGGYGGFYAGLKLGVLRTSISIIYNGLLFATTGRLVFLGKARNLK